MVNHHASAAALLIEEVAEDTARLLELSLDDKMLDRLFAYSLSIPNYKGAVKEWTWRNGWLWERHQGSLHREYLQALGHVSHQ